MASHRAGARTGHSPLWMTASLSFGYFLFLRESRKNVSVVPALNLNGTLRSVGPSSSRSERTGPPVVRSRAAGLELSVPLITVVLFLAKKKGVTWFIS